MTERPIISRRDRVRVDEQNIRPWFGTVLSVKPSRKSGWWVDVRRDDGMCMCVPADRVHVMREADAK